MEKTPWPPDPLLDEVDEARRLILAEHGGDYLKVIESYMEDQKQFANRLIRLDRGGRKDKPT